LEEGLLPVIIQLPHVQQISVGHYKGTLPRFSGAYVELNTGADTLLYILALLFAKKDNVN